MTGTAGGEFVRTPGPRQPARPNPDPASRSANHRLGSISQIDDNDGNTPHQHIGEPRARLWSGRLLYLSGRPGRARAGWRASLSAAQRLGMPFEVALAHQALGRHAPSGAQGRQHLERAQTLLRELGLPDESTRGPNR
jgi:hypothetical protein